MGKSQFLKCEAVRKHYSHCLLSLAAHAACLWPCGCPEHPGLPESGDDPPAALSLYILIYIYITVFFLAVLGLHCCTWAFSSCGKQGLLFVAVHGLLIVVAPLARGLRVSLPVQGTPVRCLVGEDPTCHRAVSPCTTTAEPTLAHLCYTFTPPLHLAQLGEGWEQVFSAGRR